MELKQFITDTLTQIVEAVCETQKSVKKHGATVSPRCWQHSAKVNDEWTTRDGTVVQKVTFDVALAETHRKGTKGGVGVLLTVVGLKAMGQSESSNVNQTRIQFSVPLLLPITQTEFDTGRRPKKKKQ